MNPLTTSTAAPTHLLERAICQVTVEAWRRRMRDQRPERIRVDAVAHAVAAKLGIEVPEALVVMEHDPDK